MWWRSAVNRSFFLCLAACRTRSSAWVTRIRLCARCVLCWPTFPLVPGLGSTGSAAGCPALFVGFVATMPESDFSGSCISGYGSSPSRHGPSARKAYGRSKDLPVPAQGASVHARVFSGSCISGYGSSPSRHGPSARKAYGRSKDLPVPAQGASVHARVSDHAELGGHSQYRACRFCLPSSEQRGRSDL